MNLSRFRDFAVYAPDRSPAMVRRRVPPTRQRGATLLFVVLLMVIGVGLFVVNASQEPTRLAQSEAKQSAGLNLAKEALIAYAVAHPERPGALPCPDNDDNGDEDSTAGLCTGFLGRLPWRTLGIGDIRDEGGQRYWYALSNNFRNAIVINSDNKGNRVVRAAGPTVVTTTTEAAAVVFAPGGVVGTQTRDSTLALCTTTGTVIRRDWCAANYLEAAAGTNNAATPGTGPFITAEPSGTFNDRLLIVRTSDFIPLVERRVAADIRRTLFDYHDKQRLTKAGTGCNCYPWADSDMDLAGTSNVGQNRGRIPLIASPNDWSPPAPGKPSTVQVGATVYNLPELPLYFKPNAWNTIIYYAVAENVLDSNDKCKSCTKDMFLPPPGNLKGTLSLDTINGYAVVLITPGSANAQRPSKNWGDYIDDSANRDGDDRFLTPVAKSFDRDRIFWLADDKLQSTSCNTNARALIENAPCHTTGGNVKKECATADKNLQWCGCSGESTVMVITPCRNTLNPGACQAAVKNLKACYG